MKKSKVFFTLALILIPQLALGDTIDLYPTLDGSIYNDDGSGFFTWEGIREDTTGVAVQDDGSTANFNAGQNAPGDFRLTRSKFLFDTDVSGETITAAQFCFTVSNSLFINTDSLSFILVGATTASETDLTTSDWDLATFSSTNLGSISWGSLVRDASTYNCITLNEDGLAYINSSGTTKFGLMASNDFNDVEPTDGNIISLFYYSESSEETSPYLSMTFGGSSSSSAGTGSYLESSTGSIILGDSLCSDFYPAVYSGGVMVAQAFCVEWDHRVEIQALHFAAQLAMDTTMQSVEYVIVRVLFLMVFCLMAYGLWRTLFPHDNDW